MGRLGAYINESVAVLTSDHGSDWGAEGTAKFKGGKGELFEGSYRVCAPPPPPLVPCIGARQVPLWIRWGEYVSPLPKRHLRSSVSHLDIFATVVSVAANTHLYSPTGAWPLYGLTPTWLHRHSDRGSKLCSRKDRGSRPSPLSPLQPQFGRKKYHPPHEVTASLDAHPLTLSPCTDWHPVFFCISVATRLWLLAGGTGGRSLFLSWIQLRVEIGDSVRATPGM